MAEPLHLRNLSVPFLSQRKNTYVFRGKYTQEKTWVPYSKKTPFYNDEFLDYDTSDGHIEVSMANRSCNITCIAMILHYFGIKSDTSYTLETPDKMMEEYFTSPDLTFRNEGYAYKSVMAFQSWDIMEDFVLTAYGTKCTTTLYAQGTCTIPELKKNIAAGYPVMMSLGISITASSGHIVVVRGFTEISGTEYIILNDPWGSPVNIENNRQKGAGSFYAYYEYRDLTNDESSDGSNGDNVIIKVSEFQKMIIKPAGTQIHMAMVIRANLWQKPNGTETSDANALFPMNADFMWHSGIHLSIQNDIHSIGAGRLLAVRNKDAINGSASFMLVKHQVAGKKVGKILPFYALYMHTDSINIKKCAETYFKYGQLPSQYNFKWLLQLFSNMLPHQYVIKNENSGDPETSGLMNDDYKNQLIY